MKHKILIFTVLVLVSCKEQGQYIKTQVPDDLPSALPYDVNQETKQQREVAEELEEIVNRNFDGDYVANLVKDGPKVNLPCSENSDENEVLTPVFFNKSSSEKIDLGADPKYAYSLKNYATPSDGCYPVNSVSAGEADMLLKSQNLSARNMNTAEKKRLGASIKWVQHLNGGPLETGKWHGRGEYPFIVKTGVSSSAQRHDHIQIRKKNSMSVAQYVHEWAHLIGNNGAYPQYRAAIRGMGKCQVSNYAMKNDNEQFAEVFTAFVTEPRILLNNTRTPAACKKAFEFFKNWFNKGERVNECLPKKK